MVHSKTNLIERKVIETKNYYYPVSKTWKITIKRFKTNSFLMTQLVFSPLNQYYKIWNWKKHAWGRQLREAGNS